MAIVFIGSVFSPYYAWARRSAAAAPAPRPGADPHNHVAVNVALYRTDGGPGARWAMTERGSAALQRSADTLTIGPSSLHWDGSTLVLRLDEWAVPLPRRLRGTVRLHPLASGLDAPMALEPSGAHQWWPIAPCARVEVDLSEPGWHWRGNGYLDSNRGPSPLENTFGHWQWARAAMGDAGSGAGTAVVYDAHGLDASHTHLALRFDAQGRCTPFNAAPMQPLSSTGWRVPRSQRSDGPARLQQTLEDAPFYARSLVQADWLGQPVLAMHESLRLNRFAQPWVQAMLPFRMPRRAG